jgi:hypothetical protein
MFAMAKDIMPGDCIQFNRNKVHVMRVCVVYKDGRQCISVTPVSQIVNPDVIYSLPMRYKVRLLNSKCKKLTTSLELWHRLS